MRPRALYLHVPFCTRRCLYCDFAVQVERDPPTGAWVAAMAEEMELLAAEQAWSRPLELDTLYLGGGTPSLLREGAMAELRARLEPFARPAPGAEWTCEANPESLSPALASDWRAAGVNRLSLGVQTFHEPALRWMGRLHGAEGPARAVETARGAGFEHLSVDLIFGLPERLGRDWTHDLERALALEPQHVSLYGLTAEPATPLGRRVHQGLETLPDEERYADEYFVAHERLTAAGFEHYEVSNFALPGHRSRHNWIYWTGAPYAGLGPSSHAFYPPVRRWNLREWPAYTEALRHRRLPVADEEELTGEQAALEHVWLSLRIDRGLSMDELTEPQRKLVARWEDGGLARTGAGRVRLTPDGWLALDRLAVDLNSIGR